MTKQSARRGRSVRTTSDGHENTQVATPELDIPNAGLQHPCPCRPLEPGRGRPRIPLLILLAVLAGVVRGNLTLLQATAVTDRWGTTHYGIPSSVLAALATIASALAPFAGAALAGPRGGYPHLFVLLAAVSAAAALLALATRPRR